MNADLLVIAPHDGGHHAEHVRWVVTAGVERGLSIALAVTPRLLELPGVQRLAERGVQVEPIQACLDLRTARSLPQRVRATHRVLGEAAHRAPTHQAFLTYLDASLPALAVPSRVPFPRRLSGLLFRPPFRIADPYGPSLQLAAHRAVLWRAGAGPVDHVFTLDPEVVPAVERLGVRATALPDPVEPVIPSQTAAAVREAYGVEDHRVLAVLFGSLEERKGLFELTRAIHTLPDEVASRLAVVVVGKTYDSIREPLTAALHDANSHTNAQVIFRETFLPDGELADLTTAADLVLAPYIHHVGSSGVVVRAAAAGTPLVAQQGGQIGREVRSHHLGRTVDPLNIDAFATVLRDAVEAPTAGFDPASARAYAHDHGVDRFTDALYDGLFGPSGAPA